MITIVFIDAEEDLHHTLQLDFTVKDPRFKLETCKQGRHALPTSNDVRNALMVVDTLDTVRPEQATTFLLELLNELPFKKEIVLVVDEVRVVMRDGLKLLAIHCEIQTALPLTTMNGFRSGSFRDACGTTYTISAPSLLSEQEDPVLTLSMTPAGSQKPVISIFLTPIEAYWIEPHLKNFATLGGT